MYAHARFSDWQEARSKLFLACQLLVVQCLLHKVPARLACFASSVMMFECTARPVDTLIKQPSDMENVQCDVYKAASSRYKQCLTALTPTPRFSLPTQPLASTICSLVSQNEFNRFPARGRRE